MAGMTLRVSFCKDMSDVSITSQQLGGFIYPLFFCLFQNQYDTQVEVDSFEGPVKDRKCRDVLFLIIFIALLGGMVSLKSFSNRYLLSEILSLLPLPP